MIDGSQSMLIIYPVIACLLFTGGKRGYGEMLTTFDFLFLFWVDHIYHVFYLVDLLREVHCWFLHLYISEKFFKAERSRYDALSFLRITKPKLLEVWRVFPDVEVSFTPIWSSNNDLSEIKLNAFWTLSNWAYTFSILFYKVHLPFWNIMVTNAQTSN